MHLGWLLTIIGAWLLADLISGIVHWAEDKFLLHPIKWKVLEGIRRDNDRHHMFPGAMVTETLWQNMNTSALVAWPAAAALWLIGCNDVITLGVFFSGFANVVHRYAHTRRSLVPMPVRFLQTSGLFISQEHHRRHHYDENGLVQKKNTTGMYCAMTKWLNPILDRLGFFQLLERLVRLVL